MLAVFKLNKKRCAPLFLYSYEPINFLNGLVVCVNSISSEVAQNYNERHNLEYDQTSHLVHCFR